MTFAKSVRNTLGIILLLAGQLALCTSANSTPTISPIADRTSNENQFVSFAAAGATDVTGATIRYSASGLPGGISINATSGVIAGTLSYTSSGDYTVTVTVTESGSLLTAATSFAWHVNDVNRLPFTVTQPAITMSENQRMTTTLIFADADNDTLVMTGSSLPSFMRITNQASQPGGLNVSLEALPGINDAGQYDFSISVTDNKSAPITNTVHLTVLNVNAPPLVTNPGPQSSQIGDAISLAIVASDPDQDVLTYTAQNLPAGLSIDSATGLISGIIATTANPSYSPIVSVQDSALAQTQVTFTWTITAATPVVSILSPGDQTSSEADTVNLPIAASSTDGGALVYAATGLPTGLTIDPATGMISGDLDYNTAGDYAVNVTAQLQSDSSISAATDFNWHVNDTNRSPVANAGPDESVITGEVVTLDGSASSDPDNQLLTFSWHVVSAPAGSAVTDASFTGGSTPQATFTTDVDGVYTIDLEVNDGSLTAIDTVVITATTPPNATPNANAGVEQQVEINTTVLLDGSASNDPDNYPQALTYRWYFAAKPAGSTASITNANTEQASFIPDVTGVYALSLEVSDGLAQATDQMQGTATYLNVAPIANAGADQALQLGAAVMLNGTASNDPDQYPDALSYAWSITSVPAGSAITSTSITNANMANASFIPDVAGVYLVRLDVSDGEASAFDQMTVTVQTIGEAPAAPTRIKALYSKYGVFLFWKASSGADNYIVYRKTDSDTDFKVVAQTNKTLFKDSLSYGQSAEYFIVAVNQYGSSEPSMTVSTKRPSYRRKRDSHD